MTLVGIATEPHVRARGAYFVHPLDIRSQVASKLEFDRARTCITSSNFSHRCWLIRADSKGSEQRARRFNSGELPHRRLRSTRLKFPKRAVERVARTARGKQRSQLLARETALDRVAVRLDRGEHTISGIIPVVNAGRFTAPLYTTVSQGNESDRRSVKRVAGNTKGCFKRQVFGAHRKADAGIGNTHKFGLEKRSIFGAVADQMENNRDIEQCQTGNRDDRAPEFRKPFA